MKIKEERKLRVYQARTKAGLSQSELGAAKGLSADIVSNLELGRQELTTELAAAVGQATNVDWKWLLFGDDAPQTAAESVNSPRTAARSPQADRGIAHSHPGGEEKRLSTEAPKSRTWYRDRLRIVTLIFLFLEFGAGFLMLQVNARFHVFVMLVCFVFIVLLCYRLMELDKEARRSGST